MVGVLELVKKNWKLLYDTLPSIYLDRERVEREFRAFIKKDVHFLKNETLESFRKKIEGGGLFKYYDDTEDEPFECIGICDTMN